jgi:hypothetical protein
MPLTIKIPSPPKPKPPPQATVELQISQTLDGNLLIDDHEYIDILVMPEAKKIITLPKPYADKDVYSYQSDLMDSLFKGGVTDAGEPQGGSRFGVVETTYPDSKKVNPLQVVLLQIHEFIKKTAPSEAVAHAYDEYIEDHFTDPTSKDSTEYGEIPPWQDNPKAQQRVNVPYTFAGYGYLY